MLTPVSRLKFSAVECRVWGQWGGGGAVFGQKHLQQVIPTYTISRPGAFDGATAHFFQLRHP